MENISRKLNNLYIVKSENDDRLYRGLELSNDMKVILISDPTVEKAAAALDVGVGSSININEEFARYFQRVLYLTNLNTEQRLFQNYVEENDGSVNAETHMHFASYYFDINASEFKNALDYFANFFIKPLNFEETVAVEEHFNVMCEMEQNYEFDDEWKIIKFIKWIRNDYESSSGEELLVITQLGKELKKLEMFHERYYCASVMKLCVLGKESLDELENLVVNLFSAVVKHDVSVSKNSIFPHSSVQKIHKILYIPHNDYNRLHIMFDLSEEQYLRYYYCSIEHFLVYLFQSDAKGSLLFHLKDKGWANSIKAGVLVEIKNTFSLCIDLTDKGLDNVDIIMILLFQYVNMLKESKGRTIRRVFNEYKEIQELKFRFKKRESSLEYVKTIARSMQEWPLKYALRGKQIPIEWKQNSVKHVIESFLLPLRMNIYLASKTYGINNVINENTDDYIYQYKKIEISARLCDLWTGTQYPKTCYLPDYNEFISITHDIKPFDDTICVFSDIYFAAKVIRNTNLLMLWYKRDIEFKEPRATIILHFISSTSLEDPIKAHFTHMFIRLIDKSLSQDAYFTSLIDTHWEFCAIPEGIQLKIHGYDNKLPFLLEKIIGRMVNFKLNPKNFNIEKEENIRISMEKLEKFQNDVLYRQAQAYLSFLLTESLHDEEKILKSCYCVTIDTMQEFISTFFSHVYIKGLIHGNFTEIEALNIAHMIETKLQPYATLPDKRLKFLRDITLQDEHHFIFYKENKLSLSSCTLVFYQIKKRSRKLDVILEFIQEILKEPFSDMLRDNEMLGYIAWCTLYRSNTMQGLTFLVQGYNQKSYIHKNIEEKIDAFMHSMMDYIAKMSEETFKAIKTLMIEKHHANKPKTLNDLSNAIWSEIWKMQYNFERFKIGIKYLENITLRDLYHIMKNIVNKGTPKLSIYMTSVKNNFYLDTNKYSLPMFLSRNYVKKIDNIQEFKASQIGQTHLSSHLKNKIMT